MMADNNENMDSDDDFQVSNVEEYRERFQNALTGLNLLRHFDSSKLPKRQRRLPKKRGPPPKKLKVKMYFLPEGSNLPKLSKMDPNIPIHQQHGFGYPASVYNNFRGGHVEFDLNQNEEEFKDKIRKLYPTTLEGKDFYLCTLDHARNYIPVPCIPEELKKLKYQGTMIIRVSTGKERINSQEDIDGLEVSRLTTDGNITTRPFQLSAGPIPQPEQVSMQNRLANSTSLKKDDDVTLPQILLPRRRVSKAESTCSGKERINSQEDIDGLEVSRLTTDGNITTRPFQLSAGPIPQPEQVSMPNRLANSTSLKKDDDVSLPQILLPARRVSEADCTMENIQERRNLMALQDIEYQESLRKDREKVQKIKEQEQRDAELQKLREERRSKIPTEPEEGIELKIKSRQWTVTRRFLQTTPVEVLMNFIGSMPSSSKFFKVAIPGMENPLYSHLYHGCLRNVGLVSSSVLQVTWLSEDEVTLEEVNVMETDQQPSTSSSIPRPQRQAAALCNVKMRDWLIPKSSLQQSRVLTVESSDDDSLPDIPDTYRNYVDVACISSDSSSESEIDKTNYPELTTEPEENDPLLTLTILSSKIQTSAVTRINVNRQNVWECTIRKLKKKDFMPFNDLLIKFSDQFGEMEEGIDQGGPKREFLDLLMEYTLNSSLFEGSLTSKYLSWNKKAFDNDDYYYAGIVVGLSLVHGGPAPRCFDPSFVKALLRGPESVKVTIEDMPNEELKSKLEKILGAKTQNSREKSIEKLSDLLSLAGVDAVCQTSEETEAMVCKVVHWYLFDRSAQACKRFCDGLDRLDIVKNLQSLHKLFVYQAIKFSLESFENLFEYKLADKGSNSRTAQNAVLAWWRDFLEEVEEGDTPLTFAKILHFATGAKEPPPLGFNPKPTICFWPEKLPKAVTCTNTLHLPIKNSTYKEFKNRMEFAVLNTEGFLLF
ncbi:uncharacterized protein LOC134250300 isoform X3 [Saccostrea cucullata]|uniref:uncharacterized protein LOC134250300 isoform X3 n=1 Tax=Saccostrea cuccullata TaxID=36930 RepID=UPI002ED59050